jgi:hypothetical protein
MWRAQAQLRFGVVTGNRRRNGDIKFFESMDGAGCISFKIEPYNR